jgi:hypothetical protein
LATSSTSSISTGDSSAPAPALYGVIGLNSIDASVSNLLVGSQAYTPAPRAGVSDLFGDATPTKLVYTPLIRVDLENNAINLTDAQAYGHRVYLEIPKGELNNCFSWSRTAGDLFPVGETSASILKTTIANHIADGFIDLDAQSDGLNYSSTALNSAVDSRLREMATPTANDLVMAYVLYKLYGKSSYDTLDNIFNVEDAYGMLQDITFTTSIFDSVKTTDGVASIKQMFRDLVSSDPQRFFDVSGKQVSGIFETNTDANGNGIWNFTEDDVVEIRMKFIFANEITRRDVADGEFESSEISTTIPAGHSFSIRFQLKAV